MVTPAAILGGLAAVGAVYEWTQNAIEYSSTIPSNAPGFTGAVGAVARGVCDGYRKNEIAGLIAGVWAGGLGGLALNEGCKPYWDSQSPSVGPPTYAEQFPVAQCPVVYTFRYFIVFQYRQSNGVLVTVRDPSSGTLQTTRTGPLGTPYYEITEGRNIRVMIPTGLGPSLLGVLQTSLTATERSGSATLSNIARQDGLPDNCGTPTTVFTPAPGGPSAPPWGQPFTYTGSDNNPTTIVIDAPKFSPNGTFSIPITIDGVPMDYGPAGNNPTISPDYENPNPEQSPGVGGQQPGEIDKDEETTALIIVLNEPYPSNKVLEMGGPEDVLQAGQLSDAGWYRFKYGEAITPWKRIAQRVTIAFPDIVNGGIPTGYQVKFSYEWSGTAQSVPSRAS